MLLGDADERRSLDVELSYVTRDPLAVHLAFLASGREPTEWTCARSLLYHGLVEPSGEGDLRIEPVGLGAVLIELTSSEGHAYLLAPTLDLVEFLTATFELVSEFDEVDWLDIDAVIENILRHQDVAD